MAVLKKFDLQGKESGSVQVDDVLLDTSAHSQMVKDYLVALRNNARQWSASTKVRKEVNRTGRKPHPQKGQGRSRQGCFAAPQYRGGGIVFGPKPKFDQHVRMNRKERRSAIKHLLAEKMKENRVSVLECGSFEKPRTKIFADFLKALDLTKKRVLILGSGELNQALYLSARNIPRKECSAVSSVNGYDLALCQDIVVLDTALDQLLTMLG